MEYVIANIKPYKSQDELSIAYKSLGEAYGIIKDYTAAMNTYKKGYKLFPNDKEFPILIRKHISREKKSKLKLKLN